MFVVSMNGDAPFAIVILEQQWVIDTDLGAPLLSHDCSAHKRSIPTEFFYAAAVVA
jgi:hypothetical protein